MEQVREEGVLISSTKLDLCAPEEEESRQVPQRSNRGKDDLDGWAPTHMFHKALLFKGRKLDETKSHVNKQKPGLNHSAISLTNKNQTKM